MNIKVANPNECPLRIEVHNKYTVCGLPIPTSQFCTTTEIFPYTCPLHSRTIVIEKAEKEEGTGARDQGPDEEERKAMCVRHGIKSMRATYP